MCVIIKLESVRGSLYTHSENKLSMFIKYILHSLKKNMKKFEFVFIVLIRDIGRCQTLLVISRCWPVFSSSAIHALLF